MQRIILVVLAVLAIAPDASLAVRVLDKLESSYELELGAVDLPLSTAGAVVFKTCPTCTLQSMAVSSSTRFYIGQQQVTLAELNQEATRLEQAGRGGPNVLVMVHYAPETKAVTRIRISALTQQ
jgi:hypothetical protein